MVMKFHHIGIPTQTPRQGEIYDSKYKLWLVTSDKSPYSIEWLRYERDCPFPQLIKTVPHVAFEVDDIDTAVEGKNILIAPVYLNDSLKMAFIEDNGAPIEFLQFIKIYNQS